MGLSAYSAAAADAGIICMILMNVATFIIAINDVVHSILQFLGIYRITPEDTIDSLLGSSRESTNSLVGSSRQSTTNRSTQSAIQYGSVDKCSNDDDLEQECSVCLNEFKADSLVYLLPCGHVFHKTCLETWLTNSNVTCPLCRTCIKHLKE